VSLDGIPWALAIRMTSAVRWSFRLTATVNSLCEVSTPRAISTASGTTRTSASPLTEIEPGALVAGRGRGVPARGAPHAENGQASTDGEDEACLGAGRVRAFPVRGRALDPDTTAMAFGERFW